MFKKYLLTIMTILIVIIYMIIQKSPLVVKDTYHAPIITIDEPVIEISIHDDPAILLEGMHATDKEDGDLTSQIQLESKTAGALADSIQMNYVVFDSEGHPARASRTVVYTDYTAPTFSLVDDLNGARYSASEIYKKIRATSCIDGDISNKITIMNAEIDENKNVNVRFKVSDSTLTSSMLMLKYYLQPDTPIDIQLNQYLINMELGKGVDLVGNINQVKINDLETAWLNSLVQIDFPDIQEEGVYEVKYSIAYNNQVGEKTCILVVRGEQNGD